MEDGRKTVVILSNGHYSPFQRKSSLAENLKDWLREKTLKRVRYAINKSNEHLVISNGDLIECSHPERGLRYKDDMVAFRNSCHILKLKLGVREIVLNAGNHELGFRETTLAFDPEGGISEKTVENFLSLAKRKTLWHSIEREECWIILVPFLLPQLNSARDDLLDLASLKKELLTWLEQKLEAATKAAKPVVLITHDPETLAQGDFFNLVLRYKNYGVIRKIIFGHYHSWLTLFLSRFLWEKKGLGYFLFRFTLRPIIRYVAGKLKGKESLIRADRYFGPGGNAERIFRAVDALEATLVPSPIGMFFVGRGFVTIDLDTFEVKTEK